MSEPFRTETVDTPAGEYVIELFYDEDAENPLTNWDHSGMAFYLSGFHSDGFFNTLGQIDSAPRDAFITFRGIDSDADAIQRRFDKWRAITGSPWILVSGSGNGYGQSHWWNWSVLVDVSDYAGEDVAKQAANAAHATMDTYQTWARGEFVQYDITDPDGKIVDSLCGIDDEAYALSEAKENVAYHAEQRKIELDKVIQERIEAANLVGAGFVGVI